VRPHLTSKIVGYGHPAIIVARPYPYNSRGRGAPYLNILNPAGGRPPTPTIIRVRAGVLPYLFLLGGPIEYSENARMQGALALSLEFEGRKGREGKVRVHAEGPSPIEW
jgi:hypothetical protein